MARIKSSDVDFLNAPPKKRTETAPDTTRIATRSRPSGGSARTPMQSPLMKEARTQIMKSKLLMPVTKKEVEVVHREIDPDDTWVSPLNPRNQDLLSADDPDVQSLRQVIRSETQRDPILCRMNPGPKGERFEVIWGSRRRFIGKLEKDAMGEFLLKAMVAEKMSDPDAARLARSENDDRQPLSPYERGMDFARLRETQYKDYDQKTMAASEGVSEGLLSMLLVLSRIPVRVMALFTSPSVVAVKDGAKIRSALSLIGDGAEEKLADYVIKNGKFQKVAGLVKAAQEIAGVRGNAKPRSAPKTLTSTSGVKAKIATNRDRPGSLRIDLEGLSEDATAKIEAFLKSL